MRPRWANPALGLSLPRRRDDRRRSSSQSLISVKRAIAESAVDRARFQALVNYPQQRVSEYMFYCERCKGLLEEPERGSPSHSSEDARPSHPGSIRSLAGASVPNADAPTVVRRRASRRNSDSRGGDSGAATDHESTSTESDRSQHRQ